jgi:hypothetical protein
MTAARAIYFLERFKREEKFLGPNEQLALDFSISALCLIEECDRLREALIRQSDNMAFVINHISMHDGWYEKFQRELEEDRVVLSQPTAEGREL